MSHIVYVVRDGPNCYEGPTVNAARLLPQLRQRGHDVTALLVSDSGETTHRAALEDSGVGCRIIPRSGYTENLARSIFDLLKKLQPTVFVPNIWIPGCFAARWIRASGVPTVAAYRSDDPFYDALIEQFVFGDSTWAVSGMVCVSDDLESRLLRRHLPQTETKVIPSGVSIPPTTHVPGNRFRIAYVGRIVQRQKRILDVGRAMITCLESFPDAEAVFFGDGEEREALANLVRDAGMISRIEMVGPTRPEMIQSRLVEMDIAVLLSDYEGTPGALMDAMACGVVPVVLDIPGGVRELVIHGETGLLVKDRNQAFLKAVSLLHDRVDLRAQLGQQAHNHIKERYSIDRATSLWEEFFESLLTTAGKRSPLRSSRIRLPEPGPALAKHMHHKPVPLKRLLGAAKRVLQ